MAEKTTIARPYADAIFDRAVETDKLEAWSDVLGLLSIICKDPLFAELIQRPNLEIGFMVKFMKELCGDKIFDEAINLIHVLNGNNRLNIIPEISDLYENSKLEHMKVINVTVTSAYKLNKTQEKSIKSVLKNKLGCDIEITATHDNKLIGGLIIRAGDLVIDGSVKTQINQLETFLIS